MKEQIYTYIYVALREYIRRRARVLETVEVGLEVPIKLDKYY